MDIKEYNGKAWDHEVKRGNKWTVPVSPELIAAARNGQWSIVLTPAKPVPRDWFGTLTGKRVLCLASGGGQQGPILSAAGADVTVLDYSEKQLDQDRFVARRDGLAISTVHGDMADLSMFQNASFDQIFHPCSNCFAKDIRPVWKECFRVLKSGGDLLAGFANPAQYIFDQKLAEDQRELVVRHSIPFSELTDISDEERQAYIDSNEPLMFGHTLEDQIGGQIDAGFAIIGFYEDHNPGTIFEEHLPIYMATKATTP